MPTGSRVCGWQGTVHILVHEVGDAVGVDVLMDRVDHAVGIDVLMQQVVLYIVRFTVSVRVGVSGCPRAATRAASRYQ